MIFFMERGAAAPFFCIDYSLFTAIVLIILEVVIFISMV